MSATRWLTAARGVLAMASLAFAIVTPSAKSELAAPVAPAVAAEIDRPAKAERPESAFQCRRAQAMCLTFASPRLSSR